MVVRIGSNISALTAQRRLTENSSALSKTFARLSSGQRINTAADDAAGLAVALKLKADSRVYTQGMRNINDGISYLNIADSALEQLSSITSRQIELAEQAANGAYTFAQRKALTAEANALVEEFNRIVESTEFNGRKVLEPGTSGSALRIQSGYGISGSVSFEVGSELARSVGSGSFSAGADITWDGTVLATKLGDVNGDGISDVITAGNDGSTGIAMVQFGDGNGSFTGAVSYVMDAAETKTMALADLDQDGALDLITAGYDAFFGTVTVRLNDGAGNFLAGNSYVVPGSAYYSGALLAVADVTGDGALDIVASNRSDPAEVTLLTNDGGGSFTSSNAYVGGAGVALAGLSLGDADGDGAADLFLLEQQGLNSVIKVRRNDGSGAFSAFSALTISNIGLIDLAVKDLNGDGALDIAAAGGPVSIYFNNGSGNFTQGDSYTSANASSACLLLNDVNGDGAADLISGDYLPLSMSGQVSIRLNDGSGAFSSAQAYSVDGMDSAPSIDAGDINGDGVPDIVGTGGTAPSYATRLLFGVSHDVTTVPGLDMYTQAGAREALTSLQSQLARISKERGVIGGSQSRLSSALETLSATRENVETAASRIIDVDIATETGQLVRLQILQQAASAVLAQANQDPALALRLLKGE